MSITKEQLIEKIQDFIGDNSLSRAEVIDGLEEAASIIELQLNAMEEEDADD